MNAQTSFTTQASDEITDAALDNVSGGVDRTGGVDRGSAASLSAGDLNRTRLPQRDPRPPVPPMSGGVGQPRRR